MSNLQQPTPSGNPGNLARAFQQDNNPIWQLSAVLSQFQDDGDYEWIRELIDCCLSDTQQRLTLLREGARNGSFETISAQAHTLKGSARDIGAAAMSEICREIEQKARAREVGDYQTLASQLESSVDDLQRVLVAYRSSLPG